jgi:hypothetical protein
MPIRFTLVDGRPEKIETDTIDEAIRFYQEITNHRRVPAIEAKPADDEKGQSHHQHRPMRQAHQNYRNGLNDESKRLIEELVAHEAPVTSEALAAALKVEPRALGACVTNLMPWAKSLGLSKEEIVLRARRRDENGKWLRTWELEPGFRERLTTGEIALPNAAQGATRRQQIAAFFRANGPMLRKDLIQKSGIPEGTVASNLNDKTAFHQLEDGRWDVVA